jgi:type I restriction enzyme, S subunit
VKYQGYLLMNNEAKNKIVPELRFPEFKNAGEWEGNTLDKISPAIFDGTHQTPKYTTEGIPFFSVENLISGNRNKFISREDYLIATSKNKPEKGDILITRIGNIGFSKIVDWDYEFSIYVTLAVVKKSEEFDSKYLHSFFQSDYYQKEIRSKSLLNAVPCKINMDELRKTKVLLPPDEEKKEQQKIGDCFSSLDDLITAQIQKLEALKAHKKGLMQQLFPTEGETVPKRRFAGFKGDWKEKTLKDVCQMQAGKFVNASEINENNKNELFPCYGGNGLRGYTKSYTHTGRFSLIGRQGALCGNVTLVDGKFHATEHAVVVTPKEKVDTIWLFYMLTYLNLNQYATGQAQPGLSVENLEKVDIKIPQDKEEQQRIGDCLSSFDELIIAQTEKIEALKRHKKGLMQGLFPKINDKS